MAVEKLNAEVVDLESPACHTAITQVDEVGADLLLAQLIRWTSKMGSQRADRSNVGFLGQPRQTRQGHIFDHPQT
jgi:hypothetical protein